MADANGNVFRVAGSFDESGTTPFPDFQVASTEAATPR
jgi:hypothetical protein